MRRINQKTRSNIVKAAKSMFFTYGYDACSMSDIAKKLDISKPALYYYFTSKQKLFFEVLENECQDFFKQMKKCFLHNKSKNLQLKSFVDFYFNYFTKKHNFSLLTLNKLLPKDKKVVERIVYIKKINHQHLISQLILLIETTDKEFKANLLLGALNYFIMMNFNNKWSVNQITNKLIKYIK